MSKTKARQPAAGSRQRDEKPRTKAAPNRGKLKPMRVSMGFREFVLDQLAGISDLHAKPMFGGVGLYSGDIFFGMMAADLLYFKVDDVTERDYKAAGSKPFAPYADPSVPAMTMPYCSVPLEVLESAPTVTEWATKSIAVAKASKKAKASKRTSR